MRDAGKSVAFAGVFACGASIFTRSVLYAPAGAKGFFGILFVSNKKYGNGPGRDTATRRKRSGEAANEAAKRQKVLILFVRSRHCGELNRGLENLGTPERENGLVLFAACKKYRKNTPRVATLWTPGTIQSSAGNSFGETSDGRSRNRFFAQNGGEKALNRCDAPVLQRKDLERRLKEQPYSFANSRLWLGANLRCLWWKRVALDSDKERLVQKKSFWRKKGRLLRIARKGLFKSKVFGL